MFLDSEHSELSEPYMGTNSFENISLIIMKIIRKFKTSYIYNYFIVLIILKLHNGSKRKGNIRNRCK
jgi:hypothetical protein